MNRAEEAECLAFMGWAKLVTYEGKPLADRIVHIPNERDKGGVRIVFLLRMGMRKGFPDYKLLIPTQHHHGLYIEAKAKGKKASEEQASWIELLREWGYHAEVCQGVEQMCDAVRRYLRAAPGVFIDRARIAA